ncbi:MAG: hypothetical protein ACRDYB_06925 [Acidimicrobiales bacterium]
MIVSETGGAGAKPILEQALDLFVYAPVGLLVSSLEDLRPEDLPELAAKGRGRLGRLLSNARVVGRLTIATGRRTMESELNRWRPAVEARTAAPKPEAVAPAPLEVVGRAPAIRRAPAAKLAIPEYEALSASQVVKRLDGLKKKELEAIYAHESATRRRRTILHRTQQLLGHEGAPGPASWPA